MFEKARARRAYLRAVQANTPPRERIIKLLRIVPAVFLVAVPLLPNEFWAAMLAVTVVLASIILTVPEMRQSWRRTRPRRRMRNAAFMFAALTVSFGVIAAAIFADEAEGIPTATWVFAGIAAACVVSSALCFFRWRLMRDAAREQLWSLQNQRRRRRRFDFI